MDKRINLELRGKQPSEVKELDLSGCKSDIEFEGLTEKFINLEFLDISNCNITSLKDFPKLQNLRKIDLTGNRLCKNLEPLRECTNLQHIILSSNRIKDLSVFEPLKSLMHLSHLELSLDNIDGINIVEARAKLFGVLPSLQYLDQSDIDGNDEEEESQVNGILGNEGDDDEDGDDELDIEEEEDDSENESEEGEEEPESGLDTLYSSINHEEDEEEDDDDFNGTDASDEDEGEEHDEEPVESTRGKFTESTRGKKRRLDDEGEGGV